MLFRSWQSILKKLDKLDEIGLSSWSNNLRPIISQFINVFDDHIDKSFWNDIYKNAHEYNAFYISGWIIKFFPYTKITEDQGVYDEKTGETKIADKCIPNVFLNGDKFLLSTLSTDNFPSGLSKITVTWNNYLKNKVEKVEVCSGFMAIKQNADKSLEPLISWAICESDKDAPDRKSVV